MNSVSCRALIATAGIAMVGSSALAADLGGNCCADLEERVAELEATTVRKGNRKVSLQVYGQVSETIMWWNDGAESNVYVQENNNIKNIVGFQGNAKINSDWSAGFKLELQIRAYRSSSASQQAFGDNNGVGIAVYNTQSVALRHAYWYLQSETYGRITVGRDADPTVGTSSISLVNPDGASGPSGPGFLNSGFFLRRSGTTGNAGLSSFTWGGPGNGFGYGLVRRDSVTRTLSARYHKDGSEILIDDGGPRPRRLTPRECARLMGYPDSFVIPVSDTQAYRQFGNSVVVPVVERVAKRVIEALQRPVGYRPDLVLMDRKGEAPVVPKPPKKPVHYKIQRKK